MVFLAILSIVLGGILKGATGAGLPIIAAPALTMLYDVQTAVALLVVSNALSNVWQSWHYRKQALPPRFLILFAGAGMAGVIVGTVLLAMLPGDLLSIMVAFAVFAYIGIRLRKNGWVLPQSLANRLAVPVGFLGGILQGTTGLSAPASLSFLNAMRLDRAAFIGTISVFFVTMSSVQVAALFVADILTGQLFLLGVGVLLVVFAVMPVGTWLGRQFSREFFDRLILVILAVIAAKIIIETVLGAVL